MAIKEIKREWNPCQLAYVKTFLLHTEDDLKDMPRCSVGSRATVSETDNEYVKTADGWMLLCDCDEDGGQGAGGTPVQPDWNQNDENAPDYVKGRTHYDNQFRQVINLDPAKDFYHSIGGYHIGGSGSSDTAESKNGDAIGDFFLSHKMWAICPAVVKFDDITREFTGPRRLPVTIQLTDNEFPKFQFYQHGSQIRCDVLYNDNQPHRFEWIDTYYAETVPLDEKYIPDSIARKSDLEGLGGAGGGFVVHGVKNDDNTVTMDKTWAETLAAAKAGQYVSCQMEDDGGAYVMPLVLYSEALQLIAFMVNLGTVQMIQWAASGEAQFNSDV